MSEVLNITRTQRGGEYAEIIDFLRHVAPNYGSLTNAAAQSIRSTKEFRTWKSTNGSPSKPRAKSRRKAS